MTAKQVEEAIDTLRGGFQADGADLKVVSVQDDVATVALVGTNDTCWDCIVPPPTLRAMVEAVLRKHSCASVVELEDPRES